jgi:hypothetical protein
MADSNEADSRQGSEHYRESSAVEPGPAPAPLGGEPYRDEQVRRDEEEGLGEGIPSSAIAPVQ